LHILSRPFRLIDRAPAQARNLCRTAPILTRQKAVDNGRGSLVAAIPRARGNDAAFGTKRAFLAAQGVTATAKKKRGEQWGGAQSAASLHRPTYS